jgi:hypothetical protein
MNRTFLTAFAILAVALSMTFASITEAANFTPPTGGGVRRECRLGLGFELQWPAGRRDYRRAPHAGAGTELEWVPDHRRRWGS